jgi:Family of unknown function (DUF6467)
VGDAEAATLVAAESAVKYHPSRVLGLTVHREPVSGQRLAGSLTGAVASQTVTEAPNGPLRLDGNQPPSA